MKRMQAVYLLLPTIALLIFIIRVSAELVPVPPAAQGPAAEKPAQQGLPFVGSDQLQALVNDITAATVKEFGSQGLSNDKIAITLIDLNNRERPRWASHRGDQPIYPASVVKLFYLAVAHHQFETGTLKQSPELERALRDMIVDSSNDATHYVVDVITGTTAGPELEEDGLRDWMFKRNGVNRHFSSLGYRNINVNQKTWCEAPYGRERQGLGPNFENRNKLTTKAVSRLIFEIMTGRAASNGGTRQMINLLHRDPHSDSEDPFDQATAFLGKSLPKGAQYYSKAGFTSTTRHDAAYIRLPNGAEYVLVVFTVDNSKQAGIIPFVSQAAADHFLRSAPKASLALVNGVFWTGDSSRPWVTALASRGERIVAVGSDDEINKFVGPQTRVIDLKGQLGVPGFIDNHTHFITGGFRLLSVELRDSSTPEEFARRIRLHANKLGPNRWITGGDWDHELWPGAPLPNRQLIDSHTTSNPVFVTRLDGHMGLANSVALSIANITRETKDPPGGAIVRDPVTGEPTGILKDDAMGLVYRLIPEPKSSEYDQALEAAQTYAARAGVTSIQDITSWSDYEVYKRFLESGRLTVRVYARTPLKQWKQQEDLVSRTGAGDQWLRLGGVKGFMDGSLGSSTALFFEPYSDTQDTLGLMVDDNIPEGSLREYVREADRAGLQCSIHAIGDRANSLLLDYFEEVARVNGPRDRRFRIEHAQHLKRSDISRFTTLGVIPSVQPYHAIDDGRWAEKRIGPVRIKTTYPFRSLLNAGAKLVFGSDWFVAPLSPILGIHAAVTRRTIDGKNPDGWVPEEKITVEEALRAYTGACAYAEFAEGEKGTLEVGKLADVAVLSQNIFRIGPEELEKTGIVYTIVGGRVVYPAN